MSNCQPTNIKIKACSLVLLSRCRVSYRTCPYLTIAAIALLLNPAPPCAPSERVTVQDGRSPVLVASTVQEEIVSPAEPALSMCSLPATGTSPFPDTTNRPTLAPTLWTPDLPTHAERSKSAYVQSTRKNRALSEAQKATQKLQRAANHTLQENLCDELNSLLQRHQEELEALAARHGKKVEYIEKLRGTSKHYKLKREVGLENAKLHAKSMEVNSGMIFI